MNHLMTRRQAVRTAAVLAAGAWTGSAFKAQAARHSFQLGLATVSISNTPVETVIEDVKKLGLKNVSLYSTHCPWVKGSPEECRAAAQKFKDAGLAVTGSGVIALPNNEEAVRHAFENCKAAGLPTMICAPAHDAFPLVEKYVKQYGMKLAVHNHGPGDKSYPSPYDAWKAVQPFDERIGLCIDVGHAYRAGADPVEAILKCHSRLYDVHLKDSLAEPGAVKDIPVEVGRGHLDIKGILGALTEVKYSRVVAFEYEKHDKDPMPGMEESVAFVRKILA
ncbi:MAG TPA: sugar phosphate isomerase/epimerase [Verrucomicrobiae bacterium]|jgi:sugar phosphate isomerase/epimerase